MTAPITKLDFSKLCQVLDPDDTGWVQCNQLEHSLLELGYPLGQIKEMFEFADMTSNEGMVPMLPFFVTLKRSGLLAKPSFRFGVGNRVLVRDGPRPRDWVGGIIVQVNVREPQWPLAERVPYQVKLDDGRLTYVDEDEPNLCRELIPPWWQEFLRPSAKDLVKGSIDQDLNEQQYDGTSFLHVAASMNFVEVVDELIKLRADLDIIDKTHTTALHKATLAPDAQALVQMLCVARADVNCQDLNPNYDPEFTSATFADHDFEMHRTPLHYSAERGDVRTMHTLLEFQADANIQDGDLNTPLHLAIQEDMGDAIDVLLQCGADANLGNLEMGRNSPLMSATYHNKPALVEKLVESGVDINKQGKSDMTALHLAARNGNATIARILLSAKADAAKKSMCGTVLDLALKNGKQDLLQVLGVRVSGDQTGYPQGITTVTQMDTSQRSALFMD